MSEIGSEFCGVEYKISENIYLLSGRTALDFILRDIIAERKVKSALLPSFCCHTMIEPFKRNGIPIRFYDVYYSQDKLRVDIPQARAKEVFFKIRYFGYSQLEGLDDEDIQKNWECVIEDCTHSWLSANVDMDKSCNDYCFTSYRKWTGLLGIASAEKRIGKFIIEQKYRINGKYESLRLEAQQKKKDYLSGKVSDKTDYLRAYAQAEEILEEDYQDYSPSPVTVQKLVNLDIYHIKKKRIENANYLMNRIRDIENIKLMFLMRQKEDVPLCVPILVCPEKRDALRQYLISKEIYCPVHWAFTDIHKGISRRAENIYNQELSLICDQRYSLEDMEREANEIHNFFMETHYDKSVYAK